jgi:hypothetical protein
MQTKVPVRQPNASPSRHAACCRKYHQTKQEGACRRKVRNLELSVSAGRPVSLRTIQCILSTRARLRRACDVASQAEYALDEAQRHLLRVQPEEGKKQTD